MGRIAAILLVCLAGFSGRAGADDPGLDLDPGKAFEAGGRLKLLALGLRQSSDSGWELASSFRLKVRGEPTASFAYEFHAVIEDAVAGDAGDTAAGFLTEAGTPLFRGLAGKATWASSDRRLLEAGIEYANLRFTIRNTDITIGRQAVTYGRSFFWNPTDWLSTFAPTQIDREYKGGVDALRVSTPLGRFSGLELVYAYGEGGRRDTSALLLRLYGDLSGFDIELLAGSVWVDDRAGIAFSGDLGGAGLRGEVCYEDPRLPGEEGFFLATLEADYRFPNSLTLMGEFYLNGFGSSDPADYPAIFTSERFQAFQVQNVGRIEVGLQASYEPNPLVLGSLALIANPDDGSGIFYPGLTWSLSEESDLVIGGILPWGEKPAGFTFPSEFGAYPKMAWVQYRLTF